MRASRVTDTATIRYKRHHYYNRGCQLRTIISYHNRTSRHEPYAKEYQLASHSNIDRFTVEYA